MLFYEDSPEENRRTLTAIRDRPEWSNATNHTDLWGGSNQAEGATSAKALEWLGIVKGQGRGHVTGTEGMERRVVGDEVREVVRASSGRHDEDAGFGVGCAMKTRVILHR